MTVFFLNNYLDMMNQKVMKPHSKFIYSKANLSELFEGQFTLDSPPKRFVWEDEVAEQIPNNTSVCKVRGTRILCNLIEH